MRLVTQQILFYFHPKRSRLQLCHLIFADDLLPFSRGDLDSIHALLECFQKFGNMSGLVPSEEKSKIHFKGVAPSVQQHIMSQTGFAEGSFPFRLLVLPLSTKKLSHRLCYPFIDKIGQMICSWTSRRLSYEGRRILIQFVLAGVICFWSSVSLLSILFR